jgi:hypothetical protein
MYVSSKLRCNWRTSPRMLAHMLAHKDQHTDCITKVLHRLRLVQPMQWTRLSGSKVGAQWSLLYGTVSMKYTIQGNMIASIVLELLKEGGPLGSNSWSAPKDGYARVAACTAATVQQASVACMQVTAQAFPAL